MYDIYTKIINNPDILNLYETFSPDEYECFDIADEMVKLLPDLNFISNGGSRAVFTDGEYACKVLLSNSWSQDQFLESTALYALNQAGVKYAPTLYHITPTVLVTEYIPYSYDEWFIRNNLQFDETVFDNMSGIIFDECEKHGVIIDDYEREDQFGYRQNGEVVFLDYNQSDFTNKFSYPVINSYNYREINIELAQKYNLILPNSIQEIQSFR